MSKNSSTTVNKKLSVSAKAKAMSIENSNIKHTDTHAVVSSVPKQLKIQHAVSDWTDPHQNKRSHVLILLPSGVSVANLVSMGLEDNNSLLVFGIKWVDDMYKVERMLSHSRYGNHYTQSHPKWIALQGALDKKMGNKSSLISKFKIKLPSPGYEFTPPNISGHGACQLCNQPCKTGHRAKASLFCFFDLMIRNETQCVGMAPVLEDDFEEE